VHARPRARRSWLDFKVVQARPPGAQPFRVAETGRLAWLARRWIGLVLTAVSIAAVVYLAVRSTQSTPPSGTEAAFVTFFAAATNLLGVFAFSRVGTVSPQHARSSVRRLVTIARALTARYQNVSTTLDSGTEREKLIGASVLAAEVGTAILGITDAINDWNDVHPEALAEVLRDINA
jgi:Co/Zn/Cd efflux system component